jgi:hypothetical protein
MNASKVVSALFDNQADAEQAVRDLRSAGFPQMAIGVVLRDPAFARDAVPVPDTTPVPAEAALAGALGGSILGGVVGLLAGVGTFALPRVGPVIAGGVLVRALTEAEAGDGARGVLGALRVLGVSGASAAYFEDGVREGAVLVTIDAGSRGAAAREILRFSRGDPGAGPRQDPAYNGPERRLSHR